MPQPNFLSVPPCDWGIETTIAKDARVQIMNDMLNSSQWFNHKIGEDGLMRAFFLGDMAQFGYPK